MSDILPLIVTEGAAVIRACPLTEAYSPHRQSAIGPALQAQCAKGHYQQLSAAGHWVQYESAEAVHHLLADWLAAP